MENLFAARPSKEEDLKLIYELQEELMIKEKLLKKAEDDMEFYKMTLIHSEENYNKVFGSNPKVGNYNPLNAMQKLSNGNNSINPNQQKEGERKVNQTKSEKELKSTVKGAEFWNDILKEIEMIIYYYTYTIN